MDDVARAASRFRTDSDLSRVNAAAGRLVPVGPLTLRLVDVALDAARQTDGAVDPTVGAHSSMPATSTTSTLVRAGPQRAARTAGAPAGWSAVRVDRDLGRVGVPTGLQLDLGATAKAWTADEAARRVRSTSGEPHWSRSAATSRSRGPRHARGGSTSPRWPADRRTGST